MDGDVLAHGAAAVTGGRRDYAEFWGLLLNLGREVQSNGLAPAFCCIALPEQVLVHPEIAWFSGVHFLALVAEPAITEQRLRNRSGAPTVVANARRHLAVNEALLTAQVSPPHSLTRHRTNGERPAQTCDPAVGWAAAVLRGDINGRRGEAPLDRG